MAIDNKTKGQIERIGRSIYAGLVGRVVEVPYISYFLDDNSTDHNGPFLVRVTETDNTDLNHWNHSYYDANWDAEPLPGQGIPSGARNFWVSCVSCNAEPREGKEPIWEIKYTITSDEEIAAATPKPTGLREFIFAYDVVVPGIWAILAYSEEEAQDKFEGVDVTRLVRAANHESAHVGHGETSEVSDVPPGTYKRLYVSYDSAAAYALSIRTDRIDTWLTAKGYTTTGKDDDEWLVPVEDVERVEVELRNVNESSNELFKAEGDLFNWSWADA